MFGFLKTAALAAAASLVIGSGSAGAVTFTLETNGGNGSGVDFASPVDDFSLGLTSNNTDDSIYTTWSAVADQNANVSFDWTYITFDRDGSFYDKFGYFIGDTFLGAFQLSTDGEPFGSFQSDAASFFVTTGQTFGFYIVNVFQGFGAATATVRGNIEPSVVPAPAAGLLLLAALGGLAMMRSRRQTSA